MKIVVFGQDRRVGALVGDNTIDLNAADPNLPRDLEQFIIAGDPALQSAQRGCRPDKDRRGGVPCQPDDATGAPGSPRCQDLHGWRQLR